MVKLPCGVGAEAVPTVTGVARSTVFPSITYSRCAPVLNLSFTAPGFVGLCAGGSKENEVGAWVGDMDAQPLRPMASPADIAARNKRDTFIRIRDSCAWCN